MTKATRDTGKAGAGSKKAKPGGKSAKVQGRGAPKKAARRRRWSRTVVDRKAVDQLSRDQRWRRRGAGTGILGLLLVVCLVGLLGGGGGAALALFNRTMASGTPAFEPSPFERLAFEVFPEALPGPTGYAQGGDGAHNLTLTLPAHLLESAAASTDPLERLAAPFKGGQRRLKGPEVAARIDRLRLTAAAGGKLDCADHRIGASRMIPREGGKVLRVRDLEIHLHPTC